MSDCLLEKTTVVENSKCTIHHNFSTIIFFLACCAIVLCHIFCYFLSLLWKVWTQESFQKVEFDRPGERNQ